MQVCNSDSTQMEPNGPVRVHLVPFVYCQCQSYRVAKVNQFRVVYCQSYRLARVNLDLTKGTHRVPGIHFENPHGVKIRPEKADRGGGGALFS